MTPLSQLIMGSLFAIIGFIFGAGITYWISTRDRADESEGEIPHYRESTIPVDEAYEEVFRIYRDKNSGQILVKIEETMAPTRVDLNKTQLLLVEKVVREEMDWIGIELPKIQPVPQPQSMVERHLKPEPVEEPEAQPIFRLLRAIQ